MFKKVIEIIAQFVAAAIAAVALAYTAGVFVDTWIVEDTMRCENQMQELGKDPKLCH